MFLPPLAFIHKKHYGFIDWIFECFADSGQFGRNIDILRAFFYALAAIDTERGGAVFAAGETAGEAEITYESTAFADDFDIVEVIETFGNIDAYGAWHAICTASARDSLLASEGISHGFDSFELFRGEAIGKGFLGDLEICHEHFFVAHARENAGDGGVIPNPAESPIGIAALYGGIIEFSLGILGERVGEIAALEGTHDDDGEAFAGGVFEALGASLGEFVHIVPLDLAEIPIIGIDDFGEFVGTSVE